MTRDYPAGRQLSAAVLRLAKRVLKLFPWRAISHAGKPKRILKRSLQHPRMRAIVDALDTLYDGCGVQGFDWNLPRRKLDDLSPRQHIRAEQLPHLTGLDEQRRSPLQCGAWRDVIDIRPRALTGREAGA